MFQTIAWISLALAFACMIVIAIDEVRHPQKMAIMNAVWPVTALYLSVFALWAYFTKGRGRGRDVMQKSPMEQMGRHADKREAQARQNPTWSRPHWLAATAGPVAYWPTSSPNLSSMVPV